MQISLWTYPWDVQDLGLQTLLDDLYHKAGGNMVSLATSYHAGRFFQPRSPDQKAYFPEDGTVYYQPDETLWDGKEMRSLVSQNLIERGDVLAQLIVQRKKDGLQVSCWTVGLHNTRLGMLHPQHVTRNAFGNANYYNLCPSSPAARDYVVTLVKDITTRYQPDRVELESINFMGFAHEHHHEKDGVGLTDEDDFLMSLCFCDHCKSRAKTAGIDIDEAQQIVKKLIAASCEREVPQKQFADFPRAGNDAFSAYPSLYSFLNWRSEPVTSLIREIKQAADPASKIILLDLKDGWLGGVDLENAVAACDDIILCCYDMEADLIAQTLQDAKKRLPDDKFLGLGISLFYSLIQAPEELKKRVHAGKQAGVDGINFYNFGLVPQKRLEWIGAALNS